MLFDKKEKFRFNNLCKKADINELYKELNDKENFINLDDLSKIRAGLISLRIDGNFLEGSYIYIGNKNNVSFKKEFKANCNTIEFFKYQCDFFIKNDSNIAIFCGDKKAQTVFEMMISNCVEFTESNLSLLLDKFQGIWLIKGKYEDLENDLTNKFTILTADAVKAFESNLKLRENSIIEEIRCKQELDGGFVAKLAIKNKNSLDFELIQKKEAYIIDDVFNVIQKILGVK